MKRRALLRALFAAGAAAACGPAPVGADVPANGAPLGFRFLALGGRPDVSDASLRGRAALVAFLATYDLASQAQARFLSALAARRKDLAYVAVVLEPPANVPLVIGFRDALALDFPVALADAATIAGRGPFGEVNAVPTVVLLDADVRVVWRHVGLTREEDLERAIVRALGSE